MSGSFAARNNAFTFDQSAVPSNPVIGDTWRERVGNLPSIDWFWNGSVWLSTETICSYVIDIPGIDIKPGLGKGFAHNAFIIDYFAVFVAAAAGTWDGTNNRVFTLSLRSRTGSLGSLGTLNTSLAGVVAPANIYSVVTGVNTLVDMISSDVEAVGSSSGVVGTGGPSLGSTSSCGITFKHARR